MLESPRHRTSPGASWPPGHLPWPGRTYRVISPTRANGQPAFGLYLAAPPRQCIYRAYSLLVITTAGNHITAITGFNTNVMTHFGLPRTLPHTD